jgi:hypothetical protein
MSEDFEFRGGGTRGALDPLPPGKTRITIRIDEDVLEWFREKVDKAGGGNYQTLMNAVLREYMLREREPLELVLRRVVREELAAYRVDEKNQPAEDQSG